MNPLDMPIDDFTASLPMRPRNCIKANFWSPFTDDEHLKPPYTVRHLMMFSRKEIRMWPNLGKKSLNEIEEQLRSLGLQFWEEHDDRSLYPLINYASESVLHQRISELEAEYQLLLKNVEDDGKRIAELEAKLESYESAFLKVRVAMGLGLHSHDDLVEIAKQRRERIAELEKSNAQLLEALKLMYHPQPKQEHYEKARAAIEAAEVKP